jgi:hypothetical protein
MLATGPWQKSWGSFASTASNCLPPTLLPLHPTVYLLHTYLLYLYASSTMYSMSYCGMKGAHYFIPAALVCRFVWQQQVPCKEAAAATLLPSCFLLLPSGIPIVLDCHHQLSDLIGPGGEALKSASLDGSPTLCKPWSLADLQWETYMPIARETQGLSTNGDLGFRYKTWVHKISTIRRLRMLRCSVHD